MLVSKEIKNYSATQYISEGKVIYIEIDLCSLILNLGIVSSTPYEEIVMLGMIWKLDLYFQFLKLGS